MTLDSFSVSVIPTKHFIQRQQERGFDLNVVAKATVLAQQIKVGTEIEVTVVNERYNKSVTAVLHRISKHTALLKTGWRGGSK